MEFDLQRFRNAQKEGNACKNAFARDINSGLLREDDDGCRSGTHHSQQCLGPSGTHIAGNHV